MNPCRKVYTEDEKWRVEQGANQLLARWNTPPFTTGQPDGFRVRTGDLVMEGDQLLQEFVARPAAPALTAAWDRELRALGLTPEHGDRQFAVFVPHHLHLRRRLLPMSHDAACLTQSLLHALVAAALLYLALLLGGAESGGSETPSQ